MPLYFPAFAQYLLTHFREALWNRTPGKRLNWRLRRWRRSECRTIGASMRPPSGLRFGLMDSGSARFRISRGNPCRAGIYRWICIHMAATPCSLNTIKEDRLSDGWVWLRCLGCGSNARLIAFSGGDWGAWSSGVLADFIDEHTTDRCHPKRATDVDASRDGYPFFEIVTEKDAPMESLAVNDVIRDPTKLA
jgi:hypothetical protein